MELPPRARRIRLATLDVIQDGGTTSACAENTPNQSAGRRQAGNYLRVRGEYEWALKYGAEHVELPPRARRIP